MLASFSTISRMLCYRQNHEVTGIHRRARRLGRERGTSRNRDLAESVSGSIRDRDHNAGVHFGLSENGAYGSWTLTLRYIPDRLCLELKSLKMYMIAYRNLGIFQENAVNRFLRDIVESCRPHSAVVVGEFTPRGGIFTKITASWTREKRGRKR